MHILLLECVFHKKDLGKSIFETLRMLWSHCKTNHLLSVVVQFRSPSLSRLHLKHFDFRAYISWLQSLQNQSPGLVTTFPLEFILHLEHLSFRPKTIPRHPLHTQSGRTVFMLFAVQFDIFEIFYFLKIFVSEKNLRGTLIVCYKLDYVRHDEDLARGFS